MRKSIPFIAAGCLVAQTAVAQKQPHIILIMTDQQRADAIGCCGNENIITPHLDSLAADGCFFSNAYTSTPSSTPARAGDMAVSTIEHYDGQAPLFLKVSFARPHSPYDPPRRILDMYGDIEMDGPAKGEWSRHIGEDITDPKAAPEAAFGQFGDEYVKNSKKHYYASVTFVDEQVGRIIRALKDKGMYDDAVICFVSDHGDMMGDHNHWRKTYAYEGSAAIPFIVKLPESIYGEQGKGTVSDLPVELRDILPTFLDAAGGTVPEDMDGMSLLPLIKGKNTEWRRWIDLEHAECYSQDNYWCALTDGKLKYIRFLRSGREQLFDLTADPAESTDLSADRRYRKELEELRKAMAEHLSERGEGWVKDGKPVVRKSSLLYSPNYPDKKQER